MDERANEQFLDSEVRETNNRLRVWEEEEIVITRTKVIRRLSFKNLFLEFAKVFNLSKGFLKTGVGLTIQPAKTIKSYLDTDRDLVTSPIKYFFIIASVTLVVASMTNYFELAMNATEAFQEGLKMGSGQEELSEEMNAFTEKFTEAYKEYFVGYFNVWTMLTIVFTSLFSFLFFRKSGYNFVENFAINTYLYAHSYILFFITIALRLYHPYWTIIYLLYYFVLTVITYKQLFRQSWLKTSFKFIAVFLISYFFFYLFIFGATLIYAISLMK